MKHYNILFIYSRDIELNDSGGARTTIQLINYLANKEEFHIYCLFHIIGENSIKNIIEIEGKPTTDNINKAIKEFNINILMVPEGEFFGSKIKNAIKNTNCKVISALHNKPGYERIRLSILLKESLFHNRNCIKRIRAGILLLFYPIFYFLYTRSIEKKLLDIYNHSTYMVLLSNSFISQFEKIYKIKDGTRLKAIENALSFNTFITPQEIDKKNKKILIVSRFDERSKRLSIAIKAWAKIEKKYPDWELNIVGFGRSEYLYRELVNKYNLKQVYFHGKCSPLKYYKEASIFLMTSAYEGWGMTLTEAQQMGCVPIVMDSFSAVHDIIINENNGIIVPDNNITIFIKELERLIKDNSFRKKIAMNAVVSSRRFEKDIICDKWIKLYKSL